MDDRAAFERELHEKLWQLQREMRAKWPTFDVLGVHIRSEPGLIAWVGPSDEPTRADLELVTGAAASIGKALGLQVTITVHELNFPKSLERH